MARIRSIKPEFWHDRKLARLLTRDERMLYVGLWNHADEHGRAQGDARVIRGQVFPFEDDLADSDIAAMLKSLEHAQVIHSYVVDSDPFLFLPKLAEHQRLEPTRVKSKFPVPPANLSSSVKDATTPAVGLNGTQSFADESAPGDNPRSLLYGTGSMEHGAGANGANESAPVPAPHPRCLKHFDEPTSDACRPCGEARVARREWDADQPKVRAIAHSESARRAAEVRGRAIAGCNLCDDTGYAGVNLCGHDPNQVETARRGIALVNETLAARRSS